MIEPHERIEDAAAEFSADRAVRTEVRDRTIVVSSAVTGDPGLTVTRALGLAQDVSPVGAACHGDDGVAVGVWLAPRLYLARWAAGRRRVTAFRLTGGGRIHDYVQTDGRIPTRFETDNWYDDVPGEVEEAFLEVGLLLDDPPFPVPPAPPPAPVKATRTASPARPRAPRTPRAAAAAKPATPTTRVCTACFLEKQLPLFPQGSDVCIDCG